MIELPNGHCCEYLAASGALAYDGRGWPWEWPLRWCGLLDPRHFTIVTRSLTRWPRRGNLRWSRPWGCVRLLRGGTVNAVGLTNPGIEWWCEEIGCRLGRLQYKIVVSLYSTQPTEAAEMARMVDRFPVVAIELNCSCPNTANTPNAANTPNTANTPNPRDERMAESAQILALVSAVRAVSRHPIIVKLSVTHDYGAIAKALQGTADAISINSVPWRVAFPGRGSPLARLGGGSVSGRLAQLHTWQMLRDLVEVTSLPVIGPSVWRYEDMARLRSLGAKAISFGSIFLRYPWRPTQYVRREQRELRRGAR